MMQIDTQVKELLSLDLSSILSKLLKNMKLEGQLMTRQLTTSHGIVESCYYSKSLYFDEMYVAKKVSNIYTTIQVDKQRIGKWITNFCQKSQINLSCEQAAAVNNVACEKFSILTGGPGCGKTTTTLVIVKLLEAMQLKVLLAAPIGRAA